MNPHSVGSTKHVETLAARYDAYLEPTLRELLDAMRDDLNDMDAGDFQDEQLKRHLNRSKVEIERLTRCYQTHVTVALSADDGHTYSILPLVGVFVVTVDGEKIEIAEYRDVTDEYTDDWDEDDTPGEPDKVMHTHGKWWRFHPTPDATYTAILRGYAISDALVADADQVTTLPVGDAMVNLIVRAEAWALLSRRSNPNNLALGKELLAWSDAKCTENVASDAEPFVY